MLSSLRDEIASMRQEISVVRDSNRRIEKMFQDIMSLKQDGVDIQTLVRMKFDNPVVATDSATEKIRYTNFLQSVSVPNLNNNGEKDTSAGTVRKIFNIGKSSSSPNLSSNTVRLNNNGNITRYISWSKLYWSRCLYCLLDPKASQLVKFCKEANISVTKCE